MDTDLTNLLRSKFTNIRAPYEDEKKLYHNHFSDVLYIMQLKGGLAVLLCAVKPYKTKALPTPSTHPNDKKFYLFVIGGISSDDITHNLYTFVECKLPDCELLDFDEVCAKLEAFAC